MRTLANILWHIPFLGFVSAFLTFFMGVLLIITIIGSPLGLGLIQLSKFYLTPFSSAMINKKELNNTPNKLWEAYGVIVRVLYFPFGLLFTIITVLQIVGLFLTIIGIPVAIVLAKSLGTYFNPVNKICVSREVSNEIGIRKAKEQANYHMEVSH